MISVITRALKIGRVAILPVSTAITFKNVEIYRRLIKFVERSKFFRGMLIVVNSPGGEAGASEMFYHSVRALSEKKPVYAYAVLAASGAYMLSCGARKILAPQTGLVGSIGVIYSRVVLKGLLGKAGVKMDVYKKGKHKDLFMFHRDALPEERKKIGALLTESYQAFVEIVGKERKIPQNKMKNIATGELFGARTALKLKLVDEICTYEEALEKISSECGLKGDQVVTLSIPRPIISRLVSSLMDVAYEGALDRFLRSQMGIV